MYINSQGQLYFGDCAQGDREATPEEIAACEVSRIPAPPTPLEQIRALEAQYADAQAKLTRQSLLTIALDRACADPLAVGLSREEVHAVLLLSNTGYSALVALEAQVEALRVLV